MVTMKKISPQATGNDDWATLSDEDLFQKRICDLKLRLEGTELEKRIARLYRELDARNILFRPPCYLADEWFVPTAGTVIGVPFYLVHPRLKRLEEKVMLEVEGEALDECMKFLRHETGHAIYNAYQLQKKRKIRDLFGPPSEETPPTYQPKPFSKNYVHNLDAWYAQCDPDEDFAETFAVWLAPDRDWRKEYEHWKAIEKLEYMDELMRSIAGGVPLHVSSDRPYQAARLKTKLLTHYRNRRKAFEEDYPDSFDPDLHKLFSADSQFSSHELAHRYMKTQRANLANKIAQWTGAKKYTITNLLNALIERSRETSLRLQKEEHETALDLCAYLTAMVSNYHFTGKYKRKR